MNALEWRFPVGRDGRVGMRELTPTYRLAVRREGNERRTPTRPSRHTSRGLNEAVCEFDGLKMDWPKPRRWITPLAPHV